MLSTQAALAMNKLLLGFSVLNQIEYGGGCVVGVDAGMLLYFGK